MNWLAILRALLRLSHTVLAYAQQRELIAAGEALAAAKGLENAQRAIDKARNARINAEREFDARDGVPDDKDPNLRD